MLIASAGKLLGMKLQLSMETGLRPVELTRLKVKDLDLDHKTVNPTTAKEATKLIEAGFQYVTTIEGVQLFKKRK